MNRLILRRIITALCTTGLLGLSSQAFASAFQLFEQDGGSYLANYHAGYAAAATDASTAFYNPAGITRFKKQQAVLSAVNVLSDFKYKGTIQVSTIDFTPVIPVTAQGGTYSLVPALNYVAPISDCFGFGFSVVVPFGLKTDYGRSTALRYAATETSVAVIDFGPSLAYQATPELSFGVGLDVQHMSAEFDTVAVTGGSITDTLSNNSANDTAYGYHLGALYAFTPCARIGLSYHSQVVHHLNGSSHFEGPLADVDAFLFEDKTNNRLTSHASTSVTLPAYTMLSYYQQLQQPVAIMATVGYTQWNTLQVLHLDSVAGVNFVDGLPTNVTNIQIFVPEHYRNTWNVAVGGEFYATDRITLRAGVGYDQSPVRNRYRDVRLPDNDRYIIALGGHFQAANCLGVDLGWLHVFMNQNTVNPPPQPIGPEFVVTNGKVTGGADVYGAQITWDIT